MKTGTVILYKADRGYGFIRPDDGAANVYVHISALEQAGIEKLAEGDKLSFDLQTQDEKISATNIKLLDA